MSERWQRVQVPALTGAATLALCVLVYAVDPAEPGHYPPCPTKLLTGLDCPFCGSMRATHQFLHGNVGAAIDLNAVTVLLVYPVAIVVFAIWFYRRWRGLSFEPEIPRWLTASVVTLLLVFTVVRNMPGMPLGTSA